MNKLFVQLGKYGDIINILPLVKREFNKTGKITGLMVAEEFSSLLDGISYAEPVIWKGSFKEVHRAMLEARRICPEVVLCQIYGKDLKTRECTTSFCKESWLAAGADVPWGSLPLIFDRRDQGREERLVNRIRPSGHFILTCLSGDSSPFVFKDKLLEFLRDHPELPADVVDISEVKADRLYDLLGIMDHPRCLCLVASDSAVLHLSHASNVPVVALVTDRPSRWHGTPWRKNHAGRFTYREASEHPEMIQEAIERAILELPLPSIIHTWSDFRPGDRDKETHRRIQVAEKSWRMEYETGRWVPAYWPQTADVRTSAEIGDDRPVPFLRDVIKHGVRIAKQKDDIIAVTNADVSFAPGITGHILDAVRRHGAAFTHRWDFDRLDEPIVSEAHVSAGRWYPGSDAFFFSLEWWWAVGKELPDMIMGREKNDEVLRQLIKRYGGVEIPAAIYHEKHASFWESPENFETNLGNIHNRSLAAEWFRKTGYRPDDYQWWPAIEGRWQRSQEDGIH